MMESLKVFSVIIICLMCSCRTVKTQQSQTVQHETKIEQQIKTTTHTETEYVLERTTGQKVTDAGETEIIRREYNPDSGTLERETIIVHRADRQIATTIAEQQQSDITEHTETAMDIQIEEKSLSSTEFSESKKASTTTALIWGMGLAILVILAIKFI